MAAGIIEGRCKQYRVVSVRAIYRDSKGDGVRVGENQPPPSELGSIRRLLARSLPTARAFCEKDPSTATSELCAAAHNLYVVDLLDRQKIGVVTPAMTFAPGPVAARTALGIFCMLGLFATLGLSRLFLLGREVQSRAWRA